MLLTVLYCSILQHTEGKNSHDRLSTLFTSRPAPLVWRESKSKWKVHNYAQEISEDLLVSAETTFSLHLDVLGWPLKRSGHHNHCEGDCGGPEALVAQIKWWNAPISSKF